METKTTQWLWYFALNSLLFVAVFSLSINKSGGDIFLLLAYGVLTLLHIVLVGIYAKQKSSLLGILLAMLLALLIFRLIDSGRASRPTTVTEETL